jgi:hypothetical protein
MEQLKMKDTQDAAIIRCAHTVEKIGLAGTYLVKCFNKHGKLLWEDIIHNTVMTLGGNLALDTLVAGSSYSVTGPFMGLISSVDFSTIAAADTMASHAGWKEAGSGVNYPLYTAPRKTCVFNAAAGKSVSLSSTLSFPIITIGGTIKGCFIVLGTGAVSTIGDTNGVLLSAGLFSGGDKVVSPGDTPQVSYSLTV